MMDALAPYRTVEILNDQGIRTNHLLYQMRQEEDNRWLFISHVYRKHNWYEYAENVKIILEGNWAPTLYDTMTGTISPIPYEHQGGKTIINRSFYAEDSLLIRLVPSDVACLPAEAPRQYVDGYQLPEPEGYTLCEPNSLLLDMAEYSLNGEDYLPQEEILKLGNLVRARAGHPLLHGEPGPALDGEADRNASRQAAAADHHPQRYRVRRRTSRPGNRGGPAHPFQRPGSGSKAGRLVHRSLHPDRAPARAEKGRKRADSGNGLRQENQHRMVLSAGRFRRGGPRAAIPPWSPSPTIWYTAA